MRPVLVAVLLALTGLSSCIGIPIKAPPGEKPFREEALSFIEIGRTSRVDVLSEFASRDEPLTPMRFDDDSVWIYHSGRETWKWLVCAGGGYSANCGVTGSIREHFLKFDFGEDGVVTDWSTSSTLGRCSSAGICKEGGAIMVFASEDRDRRARWLPPVGRCSIYVFNTKPLDGADSFAMVRLDGAFVGYLLGMDAYIHVEAEPGEHRITTIHSGGIPGDTKYGRNSQSLAIECLEGRQHFLHHHGRHNDKGERRFLLERATASGIADRRLILNAVSEPEIPDAIEDPIIAMRLGKETRDVVWAVQLALKDRDLYDGRIDGGFNEETEAAVREFREQNGLQGDTLLDDHTLTALGIYDD